MKQFLQDIGLDWVTPYKLIVMMFVFFQPLGWLMLGIGTLMFIDICTAMLAATKAKIPITSAKMSQTIYKGISYFLFVFAGFIADSMIGFWFAEEKFITKAIIFFLISTEIYSIGENFEKTTGISVMSYLKEKLGFLKTNGRNNSSENT